MSESKPSDNASLIRERRNRNCIVSVIRDESGQYFVYGPGGSRYIGSMNSAQALERNVRTSFLMRREMTGGRNHEEEYRSQNEGRGCS
jgi:hypothetical protein